MSMTKDQILAEVMKLDARAREEIAEELLISICDEVNMRSRGKRWSWRCGRHEP